MAGYGRLNALPPQEQMALFEEFRPIVNPGGKPKTIKEAFDAFHAANPHVYAMLRKLALPLAQQGRRKIGIGMLFEVLRWQYALQTRGDDFKLNNNYRSHYARLLMDREPALRGLFETRELRSH